MYRKHLIPGYKRRFKKKSMDQELGSPTEGYYRTFWNTFIKDTIRYKLNIMEAWSGYTPFQKSQIKKVVAEITLIVAFTVIAALLTVDDDDEDKFGNKKKQKDMSYINNFILYQAIRMRSETAAYISPTDILRIVKSPTAMTSSIERAIRLLHQILPWNITEDYERDTGVWKKGDNKAWAKFLRFMGYSGYNITPDQAIKSFEFSIIK
jgi:hypothetical protein